MKKKKEKMSATILSQIPELGDLLQTVQDALSLNRVLMGTGLLFLLLNAKGLPGVWHVRSPSFSDLVFIPYLRLENLSVDSDNT